MLTHPKLTKFIVPRKKTDIVWDKLQESDNIQTDGSVQDCSISIANALEILQCRIKLSKWSLSYCFRRWFNSRYFDTKTFPKPHMKIIH